MQQAKVIMPKMGSSVHEGTVVQWLKEEGDSLSKGEPILLAESEKVEFVKQTLEDLLEKSMAKELKSKFPDWAKMLMWLACVFRIRTVVLTRGRGSPGLGLDLDP